MSIILALIIFSAIILIHELGHFLLAKKNGIIVTEFSLGMGPRIWSTVKGGTRYSLKTLPFGGSCQMLGEEGDQENLPGSFYAASVWARISVVAAGPIFNFILAVLLSMIIVANSGYSAATIAEVKEGSNAEAAGLQAGDIITEFDGYRINLGKELYIYTYLNGLSTDTIEMKVLRDGEKISIAYEADMNVRYLMGFNRDSAESMTVSSVIAGMPLDQAGLQAGDEILTVNGVDVSTGEKYDAYLAEHPFDGETPIEVVFLRDGLEYDVNIIPEEYKTPTTGFSYRLVSEKAKGLEIIRYSFEELRYMIRTTFLSLKGFVKGTIGMEELSGPVGVVSVIGDTYEESIDYGVKVTFLNLLSMAIMLSANLGVMNLLPLPALDGGRLVFYFIEVIRRKPVNREIEGMVHFAGIMALMLLMLVVMYNDILKLI